jgi:hypothetical protein
MGDEGVLLHGAQRMLQGDRIYTDFFEFLPPGGFVLTELWLRVAGPSMLAARSLAIITIAGIAGFTFLACRQASRNAPFSAFLTIAWIMMSQGIWTQLSHHWFTTMFSMAGMWAALVYAGEADHRRRWPLVAGAAAGAASMVTPTCGALAMLAALAVFLPLRRHRLALIVYIAAGALVPVGLVLYLVWIHAFVAAFNDVIVWAATQYAPIQVVPYGNWTGGQNAPLIYVFPLVALLAPAVYLRGRLAGARNPMLAPCVAFAAAGFVACHPRPDVAHIAFELPLALPLLAHCAVQLTVTWRASYRVAAFGAVAGLLARNVLIFLWIVQYVVGLEIAPTRAGGLAFYGLDGAPQMLARIDAQPAGGGWFFYSMMPMMPFLTGRKDVSEFDMLTPQYSTPAQYQEVCRTVMRQAEWVVFDRLGMDQSQMKRNFPAMRDLQPPETRAFELALDKSFELMAQDGRYELRHRRDGIDDSVCAGVVK